MPLHSDVFTVIPDRGGGGTTASCGHGHREHTTAGSFALLGDRPADAFLVTRLRAAGAVILGKANLSEWANFRSLTSATGTGQGALTAAAAGIRYRRNGGGGN